MAAVGSAHAQLEGAMEDIEYDSAGSDVDAEGEDDPGMDYGEVSVAADEIMENGDDAEEDPNEDELEDDDDDEDDEEELGVGAVKLPNGHMVDSDEDAVIEDASDADDSTAEDDDSDKNSSDAESAAGEEWEGGSEGVEEAETEVENRYNCM